MSAIEAGVKADNGRAGRVQTDICGGGGVLVVGGAGRGVYSTAADGVLAGDRRLKSFAP